jgi:triosephosphate isomerase
MAGNWKMHKGPEEAVAFLDGFVQAIDGVENREVLICPPFVALYVMGRKLRDLGDEAPFKLGAQNMHPAEEGAYTGEIAPPMLKAVNCDYVILGHSERRHVFGEQNDFINEKVMAARAFDLIPILCVGETEDQRDAGRAEEVVSTQLQQGLAGVDIAAPDQLVIAYEPVWAIGTGRTATPEDAQAMHTHVRSILADLWDEELAEGVRIQYGGSVKPYNVDELMGQPDIDGALVGGASLDVDSFTRIVHFK